MPGQGSIFGKKLTIVYILVGLTVTDDLARPPELLAELDWLLRHAAPKPDWDF